jgi:hypothetical protein
VAVFEGWDTLIQNQSALDLSLRGVIKLLSAPADSEEAPEPLTNGEIVEQEQPQREQEPVAEDDKTESQESDREANPRQAAAAGDGAAQAAFRSGRSFFTPLCQSEAFRPKKLALNAPGPTISARGDRRSAARI